MELRREEKERALELGREERHYELELVKLKSEARRDAAAAKMIYDQLDKFANSQILWLENTTWIGI